MGKRATSDLMRDLSGQFLNEIVKHKTWKSEDIVHEFHRAMYILAMEYFDEETTNAGS